MGPLEQEVTTMMEASDLPAGGSMNPGEMFVFLVGHFNKLETAIRRLAAEIDGQAKDASTTA